MYRVISHLIFGVSIFLMTLLALGATKQSAAFQMCHGRLHLFGKGSRVYLFQNTSKKTVLLDHYLPSDPGVSAGGSSMLLPRHFSAIVLDRSPFVMSCQLKKLASYQKASCKQLIRVRTVPMLKGKRAIRGSFWIAENMSCSALKARMQRRGFRF